MTSKFVIQDVEVGVLMVRGCSAYTDLNLCINQHDQVSDYEMLSIHEYSFCRKVQEGWGGRDCKRGKVKIMFTFDDVHQFTKH